MKATLRIPNVTPPGVCEQRLVYLEQGVDQAKLLISGGDCARAAQHSTAFHMNALALNDMPVGQ
jgi:hypothetical protein